MRTILVTGVGAVIGYGIVRALRAGRFPVRIIGADIYPDAVGRHWCDHFARLPLTADAGHAQALDALLEEQRVELVIPGIGQDMAALCRYAGAQRLRSRAALAVNRPELVALADDKWLTYEALVKAGIEAIPSRIETGFSDCARDWGTPFLMKPRRSYASKGIVRIHTEEDFTYWRCKAGDNFMVQPIVGADDEEYTVGAFGLGDGRLTQQIAFRRRLSGEGATSKAVTCAIAQLHGQVERLAALMRPRGPTNFQFRRDGGRFLPLEVNPRISSSASLRTAFGYNEAEMCIEYYLDGREPAPRTLLQGQAERYIEDFITPC